MVRVKDATIMVKEYWVKSYGDTGFYRDEVYEAITLTYQKDPTKTTYAILQQHLSPEGYSVALTLIETYRTKRTRPASRFKRNSKCGRGLHGE